MNRINIIERIDKKYLISNIEKDNEFLCIVSGVFLNDIQKNEDGKRNHELDLQSNSWKLEIFLVLYTFIAYLFHLFYQIAIRI